MLITALESSRTQDMQLVLASVRIPALTVDRGLFAAPDKSAPIGVDSHLVAGRFSILSDLEDTVARYLMLRCRRRFTRIVGQPARGT